ncbi:uncharacterized protein LOC124345136 isoform X4 [Daphnia pulicaria]|uniref:uncharacterized protein LOC124345136 isoform X4 n=1 Tax=Daphnia pulicaria TaxID=35523 RepID=UPI001EEB9437|nr:uncharacterized protein LOC124345136 isoform X4 [Daphnia pulicaria]
MFGRIRNAAECLHLRERLEKLETVVRGLISIVANKKTEEELTEILALSASLDSFKNSTVRPVEADQKQNQNAMLQLRGAVKCSLANQLDINRSENDGINPSGKIEATLGENNLLQIEWTPRSIDCIKFSSGVWIRVYDSSQKQPSTGENYLAIPQKCLKRRANASFSIALPSSASKFSGKTCHFELNDVLIQCRVYTIEVVPNYQSLKGKTIFTEIVIPPANDNSAKSLESLISVGSNSSLFTLKWKDNSGCTHQLTSLYLKIFPDGIENFGNATMSLRIPRNCLKEETNIFSLSLPENQTCPVVWVPLDPCRKYKIEIRSEYSNTWTRAPSLWETFTEERVFTQMNPSHNSYDCSSGQLNCDNICQPYDWICDGSRDCDAVNDEQHCHVNENCEFRCSRGRQCIPSSLVCNREYDCFDGSDENYCDYPIDQRENCNQLTNYSGHLNSKMITCNPVQLQLASKKFVLISVPSNHTIWLSFNSYRNYRNQTLKIYDGPYWTSPLLLSHNKGSTKPLSMRSSSNSLYIEFPEMYCRRKFVIDIDYTSMDMVPMKLEPFFPGCGGYVYEKGVVFSPNNLSVNDSKTECVWFVEAEQGETGIILKRNRMANVTAGNDDQDQPIMTVYDGWNSTGQVLYDVSSNPQTSEILYSISRKMMIRFPRPTEVSNSTARWSVATMKVRKEIIVGSSGTIESPNYPAAYPNSYDYRWNIVTSPGTKIRLLFAFFKTQEKFDSVLEDVTV